MKIMKITKEQAIAQLNADRQMEKETNNRFYSMRISQLMDIIQFGHGIFSMFVNEEVDVEII